MMDILVDYPLYLLIVSNAVLLFAVAVSVLRFERLVKRNRTFWSSPTGAGLQERKNQITADAVLTGFLERRLAILQDRVEALMKQHTAAPLAPAAEPPFEHAARMARHGASVEDLTRACGLTEAEARLMRRVHAHRQDQQAPPSAH